MLKQLKNKKGMGSMIEIIVTSVIFTIAAFGILATLSMVRPNDVQSVKKLEAALLGKEILEELRAKVDARTWNNTNTELYIGTHGPVSIPMGTRIFNASWVITGVSDGSRYVTLNVEYE